MGKALSRGMNRAGGLGVLGLVAGGEWGSVSGSCYEESGKEGTTGTQPHRRHSEGLVG